MQIISHLKGNGLRSAKLSLWLSLGLVFLSLLPACSKSKVEDASGDVQVQIPLQSATGEFSWQSVLLKNVENLKTLRGDYAEFFLSPKVTDQGLQGSEFQGRFAPSSGQWIARDVMSLTAATLYYHLQKLTEFDIAVGAINQRPIRQQVAISAQLSDQNKMIHNNALYESKSKALLFVPYSESQLPISLNSGILAHEHFHSLFFPLVLQPLIASGFISDELVSSLNIADHVTNEIGQQFNFAVPNLQPNNLVSESSKPTTQTDDEVRLRMIYHLLWLKGINEGLADVWGWAYTGDANFIALSLPTEKSSRTLNIESTQETPSIEGQGLMKFQARQIDQKGPRLRSAEISFYGYSLGTKWARLMKSYSEVAYISRLELLQKLMIPLRQMQEELGSLKANEYYDPMHFIIQFSQAQKKQSSQACELLKKYLESNSAPQVATYECQKNADNFQPIAVGKNQ